MNGRLVVTKWKLKKGKSLLFLLIGILLLLSTIGYKYMNYVNNKNYNFNVAIAEKIFQVDKFNDAKKYYNVALKYKNDTSIKTKIVLCDAMSTSLNSFNQATTLFNDKNYIEAYSTFKTVVPADKKRYLLAQIKAKDSLKLYTEEIIMLASKTNSVINTNQLNNIPLNDGDNTTIDSSSNKNQNEQVNKSSINDTGNIAKSNINTSSTNVPSAPSKENTTVDTNASVSSDDDTNALLKQQYENELANIEQQIQTLRDEKTVRIYADGKWTWQSDQIAINLMQKQYDQEMLDYKIWLSKI